MYAAVSLVKTDLGDGAKLDATPVVSIVDRRGAGAAAVTTRSACAVLFTRHHSTTSYRLQQKKCPRATDLTYIQSLLRAIATAVASEARAADRQTTHAPRSLTDGRQRSLPRQSES